MRTMMGSTKEGTVPTTSKGRSSPNENGPDGTQNAAPPISSSSSSSSSPPPPFKSPTRNSMSDTIHHHHHQQQQRQFDDRVETIFRSWNYDDDVTVDGIAVSQKKTGTTKVSTSQSQSKQSQHHHHQLYEKDENDDDDKDNSIKTYVGGTETTSRKRTIEQQDDTTNGCTKFKSNDNNNTTTRRTTPDTTTTTTTSTTTAVESSSNNNNKSDIQNRIFSVDDLAPFNLLVYPLWVFDSVQLKMRWANTAGLAMWNAQSLDELQNRDFSDVSPASTQRMKDFCDQFDLGNHNLSQQWTLYPQGKSQTVHMKVSGIKFCTVVDDDGGETVRTVDDHWSIISHGMPVSSEQLGQDNLRAVEMLRHLPMAVCQFDMDGKVLFQNPMASTMNLLPVVEDDIDDDEDDTSCPVDGNNNNNNDDDNNYDNHRDNHLGNDNNDLKETNNGMDQEISNHGTDTAIHCEGQFGVVVHDDDDDVEEKDCDHSNFRCPAGGTTKSSTSILSDSNDADDASSSCTRDDHSVPTSTDSKVCSVSSSLEENITAKSNSGSSSRATTKSNVTITNKTSRNGDSTSNRLPKRSRTGDFIPRFVDPRVGQRVLKQMQQTVVSSSSSSSSSDQHKQQRIQRQCIDFETMLHTTEGPKWSAIQLRKVEDPITGQPVLLFSARDQSDALRAQKERTLREQTGEFFAILAHEIRTPLHQLTGFIDLLCDTRPLTPEQESYVTLLQSAAKGLLTVISDVLDYSKLEAGKMKLECIPYEPLSVVEGSMAAVRANLSGSAGTVGGCDVDSTLYLTLDWNKDVPFRIMGDPNRLRQVVLNLLSNAIKFTQEGGIHIQVVPVFTNDNSTAIGQGPSSMSKSNPTMIKFVITDTGMGIAKEHQDIIFSKYQQGKASVARNFGGTGLGLSICKLLVTKMGGTIGVDSELGKGSSFWFTLPAQIPTETIDTTVVSEKEEPSENRRGLTILVAEDNKVNQKLVVRMLERMGHTAVVANNGKEAIDRIVNHDVAFDLCLMDIQMPVMDGLEATRRLRIMGYTELPIYGLTASMARSDFNDLGFTDWLAKPIPMKDLKKKLNLLMEKAA